MHRSPPSCLRLALLRLPGPFLVAGCVAGARPEPPVLLAAHIESCHVDRVAEPVRCVRVTVPENAARPGGRRLELNVVVLPGLGGPRSEPLLVLQGGPGVPGTLLAPSFASRGNLRDGRDLVFVDQRGTGGSGSLDCAFQGRFDFLGSLLPADHLQRCRERLQSEADLSAYTSRASVPDLEAIRQALGAERWSLYGISYGTRLAQSYARRYPERVDKVILDGVVPFDVGLTADLAESLQRGIDHIAARCAVDSACGARFPDTGAGLARLAEGLDRDPATIQVTDSFGRTLRGRFGRWELAYAVRGMLYGPLAAELPAMVRSAVETGDFNAFAAVYVQRTRWVGDRTGVALHLGVYCSEDLPFIDSSAVRRRSRGTLMRDLYYRAYRDGCTHWPMPRLPDELREPWRSDRPVLLFSGERDPVTPPAYAERVAAHLPRARHIEIPGGGHAEPSLCKTAMMVAFLAMGMVPDGTRRCMAWLGLPPFRLTP